MACLCDKAEKEGDTIYVPCGESWVCRGQSEMTLDGETPTRQDAPWWGRGGLWGLGGQKRAGSRGLRGRETEAEAGPRALWQHWGPGDMALARTLCKVGHGAGPDSLSCDLRALGGIEGSSGGGVRVAEGRQPQQLLPRV